MAVDATAMVAANASASSLDHGSTHCDDGAATRNGGTAGGAYAISRRLDASQRDLHKASHPR